MYIAELVLPFLIFAPRRMRGIAFRGIVFFQFLIALTGNFGFFNWLSIVLCIVLLDDASWPAWMKRNPDRLRELASIPEPRWRWRRAIILPITAILFSVTFVQLIESFRYFNVRWPVTANTMQRQLSPLRIANPYGLFRVMTTSRPEIIIEGSEDGVNWRAYEFKYKPGDVNRRPMFVQPHMPRLDWQMWFAALGDLSQNQWFMRFAQRLLEGEPAVLKLLKDNPFPDHPPKLLRARLYNYHFADHLKPGGAWWRRELIGEFLPTARLSDQP
jgi:hypothetical protein